MHTSAATSTPHYQIPAANEVHRAPRYTLDREPADLALILAELPDLDSGDLYDLHHLEVGEALELGGGAFASFVIRRIA